MKKLMENIQIPKLNVKREKQKITKEQKRELISYTVILSSFAILMYMLFLITDFYIKNHTFTWQSPVILRTPVEIKVKEVLKKESTIQIKQVEANEPKIPFCFDPITCIRDIGEEKNKTNDEIKTMIRIAKCESGYREDAINKNTNGSIDRGIFQLNSIHKDISNQDAFNFEKNIRYAWNMQTKQGTTPWNSSIKCWNN